ncbi:MAG: ATP-dependent helicase HrpB [Pseudomonadales bacterium]|nr:ATP-dependent helicase HrpB [Pseudomonadales bacterium]
MQGLPVIDIIHSLKTALLSRDEAVLQAAPGAGKTTVIPLALLDEPWLAGKKILMLEPRRIAAKSAAYRMASLINQAAGQTVGYRIRLDSRVTKNTKIEVITEGILTRMLQQDPALAQVGLVIFDEFHERHLDSDLALSLCLHGRSLYRTLEQHSTALKILIMSATLDSENIAALLNDAPIISSKGKQFPVEIIYGKASQPGDNVVLRMVSALKQAINDNPTSSILAFLPGQGEIRRTHTALADWLSDTKKTGIHLKPLFGHLSLEQQQSAIAPLTGSASQQQKVVLATNIAETSLTIEGIHVVVDSGMVRQPAFNLATGMTRLNTSRISQAASIQRMGRAGRLAAGKCYRLWSANQQTQLAPYTPPEILKADLAPLALQLLQWGVDQPQELDWLDIPPSAAWQQAIDLLLALGAVTRQGKTLLLTAHGEAMTSLPLHPRLSHLLICGLQQGFINTAALLASLLSDRDPFGHNNPDISWRLDMLTGATNCPRQHQGWLRRTQQLAAGFETQLSRNSDLLPAKITTDTTTIATNAANAGSKSKPNPGKMAVGPDHSQIVGYLIACAYPDRIGRRRHSGGFQLANGRSAQSMRSNPLDQHRFLAVAEVGGGSKGDTIYSAAAFDESLLQGCLQDLVGMQTRAEWDKKTQRFIAEERQMVGALVLKRNKLQTVPAAAKTTALVQYLQKEGLQKLPWTAELQQWCARVMLVRSIEPAADWPDLSQPTLLQDLEAWLGPWLNDVNLLQDFKKLPLADILHSRLSFDRQQRLNQLAPLRMKVPSGSSVTIDYLQSPPVLAVKLQEMFGAEQSPAIVNGKVPLLIHLLSPAGRPLQITQDLAGFWRSSYHAVKKEMKGRYPKHPWPDDPLVAIASRKTKNHKNFNKKPT